ncbi:nitrilase-related carbon-nitrogen hydrolase [Harryflintia acetispora]|uniref:Amidohydrolase n=1 Tax=Harryflintia acetispora TaxID=1849041 RepID=A0A9X8Y9J2_9FIRM|nr:nitrilase-related carbon-nitrogen hydrolase [Harryflintia acetispora]TCL45204.1 putative amidohydrolase [Harryflintia acetispora]
MLSLKTIAASYTLSAKLDPEKCEKLIEALGIRRSTILDYVYPNNIKLSAAHLRLTPYKDIKSFIEDCCRLIDMAIQSGSQLLLLPHLLGLVPLSVDKPSMSLATSLIEDLCKGQTPPANLRARFGSVMDKLSDFLFDCYYNIFLLLAHKYNIYIAAGSTYVATSQGIFCRSYLFSPDSDEAFFQDKITLSPTERALGIQPGNELKIFDSKIGKLAILADTDGSFYECYKAAKALGAQLVLTPALSSEQFSHNPRYNASLMNAQHYNLYTVRSSFYSTGETLPAFRGASGIYAPLLMTRDLNGVVVHNHESDETGGVLSSRIDPPRLLDNMDVYSHHRNPLFYERMMKETYPGFFKGTLPSPTVVPSYVPQEKPEEAGAAPQETANEPEASEENAAQV